MAIRKDQSSFNVSGNLQTALRNAGFTQATLPHAGRVFFDGSNTEIVLCHEQPGDADALRTTTLSGRNANNQIVSFDFADLDDMTMTRIWTKRELDFFGASVLGFEVSVPTLVSATWTYTVTLNGTTYTGSDTKEVDAYCKALTAAMNGQQSAMRASNGL
jgi:hypothetical protein